MNGRSCCIRLICEIGDAAASVFRDALKLISFTGETISELFHALRNPMRIRWKETLYYMNMCGANALPISSLICLLMGLILGYQSAVQMHKYGADSFLPALVGCSIVRELGPLMIAVIATGRAGSAFAAEIATMKATEEINAMQTMGFSPWRFLVIPKLLAMICMMPLLTFFGDIFGIAGGMIVGTFELDIPVHTYYTQTVYWVPPRFFVESLTKSIVFAIIVTGICCLRGFEAGEDSLGIGRATTSSVVTSIIVIIVADTLMARMFNMIFYGSAV